MPAPARSLPSLILRSPTLLMAGGALAVLGAFGATVAPYQSLIGIREIGLSEPAFGLILVLASALAVLASVLLGIRADQRTNRRATAIFVSVATCLGVALMLGVPGPLAFVLAHGVLIPVGSSLYGQIFALTRLATHEMNAERDRIQMILRALMSLSFLAMLVFWTWAFARGAEVMQIYLAAGVSSVALLALIWRSWPRDGATPWVDAPSGLDLAGAFADIARPSVVLRLLSMGAINALGILFIILISLVFDSAPGRSASDVALYVGMVAGWEVPFLLLLSQAVRRVRRTTLLAAGAALYAVQLALLPVLAGSPAVWVLPLLAGLGGTTIISLPIAYYQDLMPGKPGTAGALLALQKLAGDVLAALAFVLGSLTGSHVLTALLGAGLAGLGVCGLLLAERSAPGPAA